MLKLDRKIIIAFVVVIVVIAAFFYGRQQVYFSHGEYSGTKIFKIEKGQGSGDIAANLEEAGLIANKIYFYYYLRSRDLATGILPGDYELTGKMTIPEIVTLITTDNEDALQVKVTFPEGWTAMEMAKRLDANNLPGTGGSKESFTNWKQDVMYFKNEYKYDFLDSVPAKKSLEGFLFPDTYYFYKNATAEDVIRKMLDNFGKKLSADMRQEIAQQGKNIYEIITMASIIEGEVKSEADRKVVSGLFWQRIKNGQALQSCATLAYVLGENKKQYSLADTRVESPYNTYLNTGLPPGPINNPGLSAIRAAIYPTETNYNYFLSDPATGATIFSKTLDEHNANKAKYGL